MILADKIMNERKANGWSQEELAEMLSVSRQSVSKWESAQAVPDLQKIIKLAEIFHVSTDYLLKDEFEPEHISAGDREMADACPPVRMVSLEEAQDYMEVSKEKAPFISTGVSLCILSPALLVLLAGFADAGMFLSENLAATIGLITLFCFVAVAVTIFITNGIKLNKFEYLKKAPFETAYGVDGLVKEKKAAFESKFAMSVSIGVGLCILSVVPVLVVASMDAPDYICTCFVALLLVLVSIAVNIFIRVGMVQESYNVLLQLEDYTKANKKANPVMEAVAAIYWLSATAIYLAWSFISMQWGFTWIVWPIAGILYAVVINVVKVKHANN